MPNGFSHGIEMTVERVDLPLRSSFRIADRTYDSFGTVLVRLSDGVHVGIGETAELLYRGETVERIEDDLHSARGLLEHGISRLRLQELMPPCSARNALDCALWDLEARQLKTAVWRLAGVPEPKARPTMMTIGADAPERMAATAAAIDPAAAVKLKLCGDGRDDQRILAIRAARPQAALMVDANRGLSLASMRALAPVLETCRVAFLEQPLPVGQEGDLVGLSYPVPFFGDESIQSLADVPRAVGIFAGINIKLDKCGGLTEALQMAALARRLGLQVMVGNMGGTSLAIAPAFVLAQIADLVDLDGPLFLAADVEPGARYDSGSVWCAEEIWGGRAEPAR